MRYLTGALVVVALTGPAAPAADKKITYDEHVRAIFREHCFSCHSADKQESGLALDSYQKTMAGGSSVIASPPCRDRKRRSALSQRGRHVRGSVRSAATMSLAAHARASVSNGR